jgi:hypothetical protein
VETIADMAQATAKTFRMETPNEAAIVWLNAVARIANPTRVEEVREANHDENRDGQAHNIGGLNFQAAR